jgi:hypothetical protein
VRLLHHLLPDFNWIRVCIAYGHQRCLMALTL